jgi:hypothetical protein
MGTWRGMPATLTFQSVAANRLLGEAKIKRFDHIAADWQRRKKPCQNQGSHDQHPPRRHATIPFIAENINKY